MKCMNCQADIPPAWVSAIQSNACPGCGKEIMDEASKQLLDELRDAMESMPNDPEGLAGWLLSNYQLRKIGTAEPTSFHRAGQHNNQGIPNNLKIADNPKSIFLQRAGMTKELSRRDQLASMAQQINDAGDMEDGTVSVDLESVDEYAGLDEYETQALHQAQMGGGSSRALVNNSLVVSGPNGRPPSPQDAAALAQALAGETQEIYEDLPPALQADRIKRLQKQKDLQSGGKPGSFSRGS